MAIVQVPLDVPEEIFEKVVSGDLELLGLVKDVHHRIRGHIPKASLTKQEKGSQAVKTGVLQTIKEHKAFAIGAAVTATIVGVGAYIYRSRRERRLEATEERIVCFKKALERYLRASKSGKLNIKDVDRLLESISELEKNFGKDVELTIPVSQLADLIGSIFVYTEALAKANKYEVKIMKPRTGANGSIVSLRKYLEIQKEILESVA